MNICPDRKIAPFIVTLIVYQSALAILVAGYGYKGSFLLLNGFHTNWLDLPMFLLTHLGDALILTSFLGLLLFRKYPGIVILLIIVVIITGLTGQLMKNFLFDSCDRPLSVFGEKGEVYTVYGYRLFRNSFPSGHSITVAAAVTALVMTLNPSRMAMIGLALITAIVSYTRIYVGAHFAGDVLAGTIFGVIGAVLLTVWLYPGISQWVDKKTETEVKGTKTVLWILAIAGLSIGIYMIKEYLIRI